MSKTLRLIALTTLSFYITFVGIEAFHGSCKGHTETHCTICQVVHQTPSIIQGKPAIQPNNEIQRVLNVAVLLPWANKEYSYHGLSPPVL